MRDKWTDERLDDLSLRVEKRFDQVDARLDRTDRNLEALRTEMNGRFDSLQRTMLQGVIALSSAMIAGFAAMIALVATQI